MSISPSLTASPRVVCNSVGFPSSRKPTMSAIHDGYLAAQPPAPPPIPRKYRQPSPQLASSSAGASSSSTAPPPLPSRPESSRRSQALADLYSLADALLSGTDSIRPLPPRPGPPQTAVPAWDPETKSHIPAQATIDAREQSYATHAQPPPRLREAVQAREAATRDARPGRLVGNAVNGVVVDESTLLAQPGRAPRGVLEGPVISGEWWLDPALARVPQPAPRDDGWLKRLGKRKESKAAAGTSPTAVFRAEKGNIDARMNVVVSSEHDSVAGTHAHVVVENKRGHVRVEVVRILPAENQGHSAHAQRLTTSLPFARPRWMRSAASTSTSRPEAAISFCFCE